LEEADFVTLHVPLTKETRHVIGEEELKKMKRTAYLVNTARGPLVDEAALAKALSEGWIAGAGLDVFEKEPIEQKNPLMRLRNVVLTPHIASATIEARSKMAEVSARNLVSVLRGEMPMHLVNPDVQRIKPLSMVKMIS
jgi:glyoxylate reductase